MRYEIVQMKKAERSYAIDFLVLEHKGQRESVDGNLGCYAKRAWSDQKSARK